MNSTARATLVTALQQYFPIPRDEAALVLDELEPCVCRGGDWLFRQGDRADCLYLLARGRMQVRLAQPNAQEPGERLVAEVNPGETIGEIGMLTGGARSADIRAVRNSLLLKMTSAAFDRLARQRPELTRHIAGGIAGRLRDRTAGVSHIRRTLKTVALVPLGSAHVAEALAAKLGIALRVFGPTCVLSETTLRDAGAPELPAARHQDLSPAMVDWLAVQEDEHRIVMYVANPADPIFCPGRASCAGVVARTARRHVVRNGCVACAAQAGFSPARPFRHAGRSRAPRTCHRRARKAFVDGKPFGDVTVPIISFLRGRRMERLIDAYLPGEIEDLPVPFFCVWSNLGAGSAQVHDRGSLPRSLRASVSLPGIFPPAVISGQLSVDGGILDNLPVDLMRGRPVGRVIAVNLTSREDYTVDYSSVPSPWRVLADRTLRLSRRYRVPSPLSLMLMAMSIGAIGRGARGLAGATAGGWLQLHGRAQLRPHRRGRLSRSAGGDRSRPVAAGLSRRYSAGRPAKQGGTCSIRSRSGSSRGRLR